MDVPGLSERCGQAAGLSAPAPWGGAGGETRLSLGQHERWFPSEEDVERDWKVFGSRLGLTIDGVRLRMFLNPGRSAANAYHPAEVGESGKPLSLATKSTPVCAQTVHSA